MSALQRAIDNPRPVRGVAHRSPMAGLTRRSLDFGDVLAQSVSAVAPSAAVTTVPIMVAAAAGSATVWAVGAAMLLCLAVASTINQFARRMSASGSLYTFVSKGLGTGASFVTGVAMLVGYGFIAMFSLTGAGYYLAFLLGKIWPEAASSGLVASVLIVAMAGLCFLVLARGIRLSARVTLLVESVSVAIIVVLIVALLTVQPAAVGWSSLDLANTDFGDFATGAVLAITAFVGFESASTLGVEAKKPFASVPRAITWTVIVAGGLYLLGSYSQLVGFAGLGKDIRLSASPVNDLATAYGLDWVGVLLDASIATSFFACAVASTTALVRVLFSMGREGLIPWAFGRAHPRLGTPIVAIAATVPVLALIPMIAIAIGNSVWDTMGFLIVAAAAGYISAYILVCLAAPFFLAKIGELTPWPAIRAIVAAVLLTVGLVTYLLEEASSARSPGVWIFLAIVATGVAAYGWVRSRRPWLRHSMGVFDETTAEDVLGGGVAQATIEGGPGATEQP